MTAGSAIWAVSSSKRASIRRVALILHVEMYGCPLGDNQLAALLRFERHGPFERMNRDCRLRRRKGLAW